MRRLLALAVIVPLMVLPDMSGAATPLTIPAAGTASPPYQQWVDKARVPTPTESVTVTLADCPEAAGSACASYLNEIWLPPTFPDQRQTMLHELGHVFDFHHLDTDNRDAFSALMSDARGWDEGAPDSLRERWADVYSFCALPPRLQHHHRYWRDPGTRHHGVILLDHHTRIDLQPARHICRWIRTLG